MTQARGHQWRWDVAAVVLSFAVSVVVIATEFHQQQDTYPLPGFVAFPLALAGALALLARRRFPIPVAVFTGSMAVVFLAFASHGLAFPLIIALYSLAKYERRWVAIVAGTAVIVGGVTATAVYQSMTLALSSLPWLIISLEAGIIAGDVVGRQQRALAEAQDRAAAAERSKEELARRRAAEERVRLARELHDSLTHAISVVNVQSSVALHMLERQPQQAEASLRNIREASQDAMRELRATLRALRVTDGDATPGIDSLPALIDRSAIPISLEVSPVPRSLPETVDRTVYRIVQESLTNATRHAQASAVSVDIVIDTESVTATITDDGVGPQPDGIVEGWGLMGMRERVSALGGDLKPGPGPRGGFQVRAVLPLTETTAKELT